VQLLGLGLNFGFGLKFWVKVLRWRFGFRF